jgi:hypothetical protein
MNAAGQSSSYDFSTAQMTDRARVWMWTRLTVAYLLLECALWTYGEPQRVASLIFLAWVIATTVAQRPTLKELGLGLTGLAGASLALVYTAIAFGLMVTLAASFGTLRSIGSAFAFSHAAGYVLWSFIQEFILNAYFYLTLEKLLGNRNKAMWGAISLFVLAHIPNLLLLVATFLLSWAFVPLFRRYRNIYPLGLGHAVLGLTLALTVPDKYVAHMRVGLGYLHLMAK